MSNYGFGGDPEFGGGFGGGVPQTPQQPQNGQQDYSHVPVTDDEFSLDFTNAEAIPEFVPMPPGEYEFMVATAVRARAKTGAAMVNLELKVWTPGQFEGRIIKDRLVVPRLKPDASPQDQEKFKKSLDFFCHALECITGTKWKGEQRSLNPERDLQNQLCRAYVTQKPNQNDPNIKHNEIARYLPKNKTGSTAPSSGGAGVAGGFGG